MTTPIKFLAVGFLLAVAFFAIAVPRIPLPSESQFAKLVWIAVMFGPSVALLALILAIGVLKGIDGSAAKAMYVLVSVLIVPYTALTVVFVTACLIYRDC